VLRFCRTCRDSFDAATLGFTSKERPSCGWQTWSRYPQSPIARNSFVKISFRAVNIFTHASWSFVHMYVVNFCVCWISYLFLKIFQCLRLVELTDYKAMYVRKETIVLGIIKGCPGQSWWSIVVCTNVHTCYVVSYLCTAKYCER
jgi:hypothetical protein